jgi:DNA-binding MarR family transcriptional regulator
MDPKQVICEQVVSALRGIARSFDLHYRRLLRDYGLSGPQIIVLSAISVGDRQTISEIARDVHLSHATVTAIIARLIRKGLVGKTPSNRDRRERVLSLTPEGAATAARSSAFLYERLFAEFARLEPWEQERILTSLRRVAQMIGATDKPESVPPETRAKSPQKSNNANRPTQERP